MMSVFPENGQARDPNANPKPGEAESLEPLPVAASVPGNEVSITPPPVKKEATPRPSWFPLESPTEDARRFVDQLAARRRRETGDMLALEMAGVSFAAFQSAALAAERERRAKPKQRLYGMPTCGDALND